MKKIILFTLTISLMSCSVAKKKEQQKEVVIHTVSIEQNTSNNKGEEVFTVVENPPEFPGGQDELDKFIQENLKSSRRFKKGNAYVQFIVEKDGSLTDIKIIRGLSPSQDKEVLRLISIMPKWIPGKQREKNVRVRYVLPVKFT